jgi:single-strand DNA-binding protein
MLNKVLLIGNLGRDPELRSTPSGQQRATFSLATNRQWKDKNGERQEQTEWHNIVVWGKQAEIAQKYLTKGRQIFVEGRLQTRSWDDAQTGAKRFMTEIVCDNFQMLGKRGGFEGDMDAGAPAGGGGGPSYDEGLGGPGAPEDDDIPF